MTSDCVAVAYRVCSVIDGDIVCCIFYQSCALWFKFNFYCEFRAYFLIYPWYVLYVSVVYSTSEINCLEKYLCEMI